MRLRQQMGALQGRNHEASDSLAIDAWRQLASLHRSLQAIGDGLLHLGEYLHEPMPNDLAVIVRFSREIPQQAAIAHAVPLHAAFDRVDIGAESLSGGSESLRSVSEIIWQLLAK